MKKFLLSFVLVLFACTCVFTACGKQGLKDNPATDAEIIGNGGYAVIKGDYLYYVNGYVDDYVNALRSDTSLNKQGSVVFGGIYRTKLVNGKVQKNENGFLTNTEQVVSQVVGFENGGFYILGDYIYYVSPHMNQDGGGTVRSDYTNFYRINIDGTDTEKLYTSRSVSVDAWCVYEVDGENYVVVVEKVYTDENESSTQTNIVAIDEDGKTKTLASEINSYVLGEKTETENDFDEYVYYTATFDGVQKVCKSHIATAESEEYVLTNGATYSLVDYKNDNLYLTITNGATKLYRLALNTNENLTNITPYELTKSEYSQYWVIEDVLNSIVAVDSDNYMYYIVNGNANKLLLSNSVTVVGISDNCVYYIDSSVLKRVSIETAEIESLGSGDKSYLLSLAKQVDIDGRRIYLFAQYAQEETNESGEAVNNYYLNFIDVLSNKEDSEFVGTFKDGHTPKEPTDEEKEDGAIWIK